MEQRTKEWFEARLGRFTGSSFHALMGVKGIGQTGKTYVEQKAIDEFVGYEDKLFVTFDMQRGIDQEPRAIELFELEHFLEVDECGFCSYGDHAGASPDGIIKSENAVLEIKCPKRNNFFKVKLHDYIDPKYMTQMQMEMLCTGTDKCYYYNYFIDDKGVEHTHTIIIKKDEEYFARIEERLNIAIELKQEILTKLN